MDLQMAVEDLAVDIQDFCVEAHAKHGGVGTLPAPATPSKLQPSALPPPAAPVERPPTSALTPTAGTHIRATPAQPPSLDIGDAGASSLADSPPSAAESVPPPSLSTPSSPPSLSLLTPSPLPSPSLLTPEGERPPRPGSASSGAPGPRSPAESPDVIPGSRDIGQYQRSQTFSAQGTSPSSSVKKRAHRTPSAAELQRPQGIQSHQQVHRGGVMRAVVMEVMDDIRSLFIVLRTSLEKAPTGLKVVPLASGHASRDGSGDRSAASSGNGNVTDQTQGEPVRRHGVRGGVPAGPGDGDRAHAESAMGPDAQPRADSDDGRTAEASSDGSLRATGGISPPGTEGAEGDGPGAMVPEGAMLCMLRRGLAQLEHSSSFLKGGDETAAIQEDVERIRGKLNSLDSQGAPKVG